MAIKTKTKNRCATSGDYVVAYEAQRVYHCACGAHLPVRVRHNPVVGGQRMDGYFFRVPTHTSAFTQISTTHTR